MIEIYLPFFDAFTEGIIVLDPSITIEMNNGKMKTRIISFCSMTLFISKFYLDDKPEEFHFNKLIVLNTMSTHSLKGTLSCCCLF